MTSGLAIRPPDAAGEAQLVVDEVTFSYPEHPVLHGVSFAVRHGDFVGVVGPNGSGKSTLLRVIDGLLRPEHGAVLLDGRAVLNHARRDLARRVALVPQQFSLDFDFTALEVVEMGRYCRGEGGARASARRALQTLGVEHLAERLFPRLSGGERQMVVLAQALAQQPEVLLLDEPVSALDVAHQLQFFDCLERLNRGGLTVVCVLHDLNLALQYCRSLLMLADGGVAAWGPADEVLSPRVIGDVYGVSAHLHRHAGQAYLTFSPRPRPERRGRVHLLCGAGTGSLFMRRLTEAGYAVSAGVVNALDTDEVTGREMGLPMAVEAAFCAISDEVHEENAALAAAADVVILTDVPIGPGNLRNLEILRAAVARGTPAWMVAGLAQRDFSGGSAGVELAGVRQFPDGAAMLDELCRRPLPPH